MLIKSTHLSTYVGQKLIKIITTPMTCVLSPPCFVTRSIEILNRYMHEYPNIALSNTLEVHDCLLFSMFFPHDIPYSIVYKVC